MDVEAFSELLSMAVCTSSLEYLNRLTEVAKSIPHYTEWHCIQHGNLM